MNKKKKRFIIVLIFFILVLIVFTIFSYVVYKRSAMASFLELSMNQMDIKNKDATKEEFEEEIKNLDNEDYEIMSKFDVMPSVDYIENMKVYTYDIKNNTADNSGEKIVLYLHGGAYVLQINELQVNTAYRLASRINGKLYIPIYPLAPNHTAIETYDLLEKLYMQILEENNLKVILAGDSAGGGLALGFYEYLVQKGIKVPDKLILISPWVDISMENEAIAEYEENDPMLNKTALIVEGNAWRGELSNKDYRVSPIYGDFKGIGDTIIFTGTREILYPDIVLLHQKMIEAGVNAKLEIGENMNHVYVGYPIKEADEAIEKIVEFVQQ